MFFGAFGGAFQQLVAERFGHGAAQGIDGHFGFGGAGRVDGKLDDLQHFVQERLLDVDGLDLLQGNGERFLFDPSLFYHQLVVLDIEAEVKKAEHAGQQGQHRNARYQPFVDVAAFLSLFGLLAEHHEQEQGPDPLDDFPHGLQHHDHEAFHRLALRYGPINLLHARDGF